MYILYIHYLSGYYKSAMKCKITLLFYLIPCFVTIKAQAIIGFMTKSVRFLELGY